MMNKDQYEHYYAVIMAGGGGTRLWPLSRKMRPKQMLSLFDERTLFQTSVQRLGDLFPPERMLVVTVREQAEELQSQCPQIPQENFLIEPLPRQAEIGLIFAERREESGFLTFELNAENVQGIAGAYRFVRVRFEQKAVVS